MVTAYYCLVHTTATNILYDFTALLVAMKQSQPADPRLVGQYAPGKRTKEVEWNKVFMFLSVLDDFWMLSEDLLSLYMEFNVGEFMQRVHALLPSGSPSRQQLGVKQVQQITVEQPKIQIPLRPQNDLQVQQQKLQQQLQQVNQQLEQKGEQLTLNQLRQPTDVIAPKQAQFVNVAPAPNNQLQLSINE